MAAVERSKIEDELQAMVDELDPPGREIFGIVLCLLRKKKRPYLEALMGLAHTKAKPNTGEISLDDDELIRMLNMLPEQELLHWLRSFHAICNDDDAPRFNKLLDLLRLRTAN